MLRGGEGRSTGSELLMGATPTGSVLEGGGNQTGSGFFLLLLYCLFFHFYLHFYPPPPGFLPSPRIIRAVHGAWGPWSELSRCSVSCGIGAVKLRRSCDAPPPQHGGRGCQGNETRTAVCGPKGACPGERGRRGSDW